MKRFSESLLEAAEPNSVAERNFKNNHVILKFNHPVAFEHQFTATGIDKDHSKLSSYRDGQDVAAYRQFNIDPDLEDLIFTAEQNDIEESIVHDQYQLKKTGEMKSTIKHPEGRAVYHVFHNQEKIGSISPWSASIEKRTKGKRYVDSRRDTTKYQFKLDKGHGPESHKISVSTKLDNRTAKDAFEAMKQVHNTHIRSMIKEAKSADKQPVTVNYTDPETGQSRPKVFWRRKKDIKVEGAVPGGVFDTVGYLTNTHIDPKDGKRKPLPKPKKNIKEAADLTRAQVMRRIKNGTHEANQDVRPGWHVDLRNTSTGKVTSHYVRPTNITRKSRLKKDTQ